MKTEVTRADGWLNYWTSQQTARLDCNTDTHRYCYFWCIVYPIPMSNTCLSALTTCEQPSIYCIRCCLSTDVQVLANRGNVPRCLQAELHSGQIVSSLPEAPKPSRQRSLFAPIGNNGIKREAMQAQGEHANSPSLRGGTTSHHVNKCIIFIIYCSPGLSSGIDALSSGLVWWQRARRDQKVALLWERTRTDRIKHGHIRGTASACQMFWR